MRDPRFDYIKPWTRLQNVSLAFRAAALGLVDSFNLFQLNQFEWENSMMIAFRYCRFAVMREIG